LEHQAKLEVLDYELGIVLELVLELETSRHEAADLMVGRCGRERLGVALG
jgi:hypothetical protein